MPKQILWFETKDNKKKLDILIKVNTKKGISKKGKHSSQKTSLATWDA